MATDAASQEKDILEVLQFIDRLLVVLLDLVPPLVSRQYRRVWQNEITGILQDVQSKVVGLSKNPTLQKSLNEVGWGPDSARLKSDTIAAKAGEGRLGDTLHLVNSALGSLKVVFLALEPVKEFKEFLEVFVKERPEPEPLIQTIFGPGPIPGPKL